MKPIEPGCLAIVSRGVDAGKNVRCLEFVGNYEDGHSYYDGGDLWRVDRVLSWTSSDIPYCPESMLLRIDGHEEPTTTEKAVEA